MPFQTACLSGHYKIHCCFHQSNKKNLISKVSGQRLGKKECKAMYAKHTGMIREHSEPHIGDNYDNTPVSVHQLRVSTDVDGFSDFS